jgi:hypothetical protein
VAAVAAEDIEKRLWIKCSKALFPKIVRQRITVSDLTKITVGFVSFIDLT